MIKFIQQANNSGRYDVHFTVPNVTWYLHKAFIDEVLESKMSLLFALKSEKDPETYYGKNLLRRFAKLIMELMGPPHNVKFEYIQEIWNKAKK